MTNNGNTEENILACNTLTGIRITLYNGCTETIQE